MDIKEKEEKENKKNYFFSLIFYLSFLFTVFFYWQKFNIYSGFFGFIVLVFFFLIYWLGGCWGISKYQGKSFSEIFKKDAFSLVPFFLLWLIPAYLPEGNVLRDHYFRLYFSSYKWQLFLLVILFFASFLIRVMLHSSGLEDFLKRAQRHGGKLCTLIVLIYLLIFIPLNLWTHSILENWEDLDTNVQSFQNTLEGKFFQSNLETTTFRPMNVLFGTHNRPILLLLLPFYALFPRPETLLILKVIFLALAGVPLFLILKDRYSVFARLHFVAAFYGLPYLISQNFMGFHEVALAPFFILWTYFFFHKRAFLPFLVSLALTIMIKEQIALVMLLFVLIAILQKRSWKWLLAPALICIIWIILTFALIFPLTRPADALIIEHYSKQGIASGSLTELIIKMLQQPSLLISRIAERFYYPYLLLSPMLLILPFLAWEFLFVLPFIFQNVVLLHFATPITFHHSMEAAPFVVLAAARGLYFLAQKFTKLSSPRLLFLEIGSVLVAISMMLHFPVWREVVHLKPSPRLEFQKAALALIPENVGVALPMYMGSQLAHRNKLYYLCPENLNQAQSQDSDRLDIEYVIADTKRQCFFRATPVLDELKLKGSWLGYKKIFEADCIFVLKREN